MIAEADKWAIKAALNFGYIWGRHRYRDGGEGAGHLSV